MTRDEALTMVAALSTGRARWLAETVSTLQADGVWLVGSLASGNGDEWSDVDILVVGGHRMLNETLLTIEMPGNGPGQVRRPTPDPLLRKGAVAELHVAQGNNCTGFKGAGRN